MYLDPGFGSMVIQMAIGGVAALGAGFYLFRQKIRQLFGRAAPEEGGENNQRQEGDDKNTHDAAL